MTSYGQYQDAVLNKINDLANPQTNNAVISATTDIADATLPPTPLLCDAQGHLQVDILSGGGHPSGDASADNQTNGNQKTQVFGVDPANNQVQMSVENGGKLQVQVVGSNDINGGTPHRHLTIDANGRTLTAPLMTSTNTAINNMSDKITKGSSDVANATGLQQVLVCGKDAFGANDLKPIGMSGDRLLVEAPELANINPITANGTTAKGGIGMLGTNDGTNYRTIACDDNGHLKVDNITAGADATLSTAQQVACYGRDQSGNLDCLNVDNNGHLKITLNDIEAGIVNSINVASKHDNAYLEILTGGSVSSGASITTNPHTLSAGAGSVGGKQPITIYIHFGAGTSDSNFSVEVEKSYDNSIYFIDSNFSFNPLGFDTQNPPVSQPAVVANGFSDGRSIKVKITNNAESNPTSVKVIIIERQ